MAIAKNKRNMTLLVGILLVLLLVMGWVGYRSVNRVAELTEQLYDHPFTVSTAVLRIRGDVAVMHRSIKDVVLSSSTADINRFAKQVDEAELRVLADLELVQELYLGNPQSVKDVRQKFLSWRPIWEEVIKLSLAGRKQEAGQINRNLGNPKVVEIDTAVEVVRDFARNKARLFLADAKETRSQTLVFILLVMGTVFLVGVLISRKAVELETELQRVNQNLEQIVRDRTDKLAIANENLNAQNEEITAMNEELSAQNEEIRAMNEEIDALNQNLIFANEGLEQRVAERTADLTAAHEEISAQYEEITAQYGELKEMQESLQEEQILTDALFNSVPGILYLYDGQGRLLRWNKEHEKMTGYSAEEMSQMKLLDWYKGDEETIARVTKEVGRAYREGFASTEADLQIKDGARIPLYLTAVPLKLDGKQYFAGIGIDISEQKKIEYSLAEKEVRLRTLVNTIPDLIWLKDEAGVYLECNPMFERFFGAPETEIIGRTDYNFLDKELADFFREHDRKAMETGGPSINEEWLDFADTGERGLFETIKTPMLDSKGKLIGVLGIARNITERNRMEAALEESEARYRAVMEQAPEAVIICNPDTGDIVEANRRFTERFGYDLNKEGPLKVYQITVDTPESIKSFLDRVKQERTLPVQRRTVRHRNGALVHVERSATLVQYGDRTLVALTIRDVSDEIRREQEIHRDAQLATRVQNALLKMAEPSEYVDLATVYHPYSYVGGDLYFTDWRYDKQVLRGFVIDATGHGLGTALHTSSMHVLLREVNELDLPLSDQMRWINQRVGQYFDEGTFAGAIAFELDLQMRQLRWVCAGIPEIWVSTPAVQGVVAKPGMYLGVDDEESFEMHTLPIGINDAFYFLTDGLAEKLNICEDMPINDYSAMIELLGQLSEQPDCRDDATAICLQVMALPQQLVPKNGWPKKMRFNGYGDYQRLKREITDIMSEVTGLSHSLQEVAVNEAVANALECRDGVPRQHRAVIYFNRIGDRLIVRVKSSRMGFAGNAILRRLRVNPDELFSYGEDAGMGRGIPIMLSISHKMIYNSEGTELLLAWNLRKKKKDGEN